MEPQDPAYTVKRKPRGLYNNKGDESSDKEGGSKRKDAVGDALDPNDSDDNGDNDSSKDE